ncbi:hypothetical protein OL67_000691 [Phaeobacter piscinae]|nr:hypothetical protein OL67_000691 [Phaeobacter piscinae]
MADKRIATPPDPPNCTLTVNTKPNLPKSGLEVPPTSPPNHRGKNSQPLKECHYRFSIIVDARLWVFFFLDFGTQHEFGSQILLYL